MRKIFFLNFTLFFSCIGLNAQNIACGLLWSDTTQQYHFCRVNATTGQTIFSNPVPGMTSAYFNTAMVDVANNQYILKVYDPGDRYYAFDITTGLVVSDVPAPDPIGMFEIHPTTGIAYGLFSDMSFLIHFVSVDVHTGVMTYLSTIPGSILDVGPETSVLNHITNQYIFVGSNSPQYFTIDIATGAVVDSSLALSEVNYLRIHPGTGLIYGLWKEANFIWRLVSVDNLTGQHTVIGSAPGINNSAPSDVFLDPVDNLYTYSCGNPPRYYALDLASGVLVSDTPTVEECFFLEWCGITTGIEEHADYISASLAPNPFHDQTILTVDNSYNEILTISVSDMSGRTLIKQEEQGLNKVIIDRNLLGLKSGMYLIVISRDDHPVSQSKIIVQ